MKMIIRTSFTAISITILAAFLLINLPTAIPVAEEAAVTTATVAVVEDEGLVVVVIVVSSISLILLLFTERNRKSKITAQTFHTCHTYRPSLKSSHLHNQPSCDFTT